ERDVVVARGEARIVACLAERDDRREHQLIGVVALVFRRREAGPADLEIPVAGEPAALPAILGECERRGPGEAGRGECRPIKAMSHEAPGPAAADTRNAAGAPAGLLA